MTTVTWKEGGPLFLQPAPGSESGLVAIDGDCCCPPPPPPRCWDCLDMCAYFIEVTTPGELAVKSPPYPCSGASAQGSVIVPYMLLDAWPPETDPGDSSPTSWFNNSSAAAENFRPYQWLIASVVHSLNGGGIWPTDTGTCGTFATSNFTSEAIINCVVKCTPGAASPFTVELSAHVYVFLDNSFQLNNGGSPYCNGWWRWKASVSFPLTSTCQTAPARQCVSTGDEFQVLDTPVSVTADGTTTSIGAYTANASTSYGDYASTAQSIGEALRDALTATFRITSRSSCASSPCGCGQSLAGIQLQFFGELFTVGNEPDDIRGADSRRWVYTDSATSPNITYEVFNESFTETYYFASATISCSPSEDPETVPDKWLLTVSATCFTWDDDGNGGREIVEQTTKTWVGEYECTEHCEVSLPYGVPLQLVLVSTVTPPGLGACDPGSSGPPVEIQFAPCE
jgi:hypothetical protein